MSQNEPPEWTERMLIGEHQHSLDDKGRVFIPARFREELGGRFIATKGLDGCLFVYSEEEWKLLEEKIHALPLSKARNLQRFFFAGAAELEADKQGRVLLPANLREYAGLARDVMIIGAMSRVEVWDKRRWEETIGGITAESIEQAMEDLGF